MTCLINKHGEKVYDGKVINQIATDRYIDLCVDNSPSLKLVNQDKGNLELEFLKAEIKRAIKKLKDGMAAGHDGISNEHIKYGGEKIIKILTQLYNTILKTKSIPHQLENFKYNTVV